jgi:hypothetical protein
MVRSRLNPALAFLLVFPLFCNILFAQQSTENSAAAEPGKARWRFGTELDVVPYATGGYYVSGFAGHGGWRLRGVGARTNAPGFMVSSGFEQKRTDAYALLVDRFFGSRRTQLRGFWLSGGGEYWRNRIRQENPSPFSYYDNFVLTAGGGYVWKLSNHFYLNPWTALHFVAAGDRNINVSGKTYEQPVVTPEVSVKIGFIF